MNRKADPEKQRDHKAEALGILAAGTGLLVAASLLTYDPLDPSWGSASTKLETGNIAGPFGSYLSDALFQFVGGGAFLVPLFLIVYGINKITGRPQAHRALRVLGALTLLFSTSTLLRLSYEHLAFGGIRAGGLFGEMVARPVMDVFGPAGSYILAVTLLLAGLVVSTALSLMTILTGVREYSARLAERVRTHWMKYDERKKRVKAMEERVEAPPGAPPEIVETAAKPAPPQPQSRLQESLPFTGPDKEYTLPPMSLLVSPPSDRKRVDKGSLIMSSNILEKKIRDFGVDGKVAQVHPGPVVTMYEFEPASGVKVNKVAALADDLALAMRAESVRIVAPLPGKAAVGIEIPNNVREDVFFKEILSSAEFSKSKSPLTLALGKDIYGAPVVSDLAKMPHLLVAGATGSGKSVAVNTMTMSLLMSAKPRDLRMVMVDPKRLELSVYEGIPHLLDAVITEPRRAASALRKVVVVMEERYKLLAGRGVRNIEGYNAKVMEEKAHPRLGEEPARESTPEQAVVNEDGTLPYIVVIIDELADLMMVAAKEVEDSIARLAQMARASGIHLVIATQRPSVDVLTGVIKANFPARMSFQVSSKTDSRTILDANGAEALLGKGDMLFMPPGSSKITRIHGSYVTEDEIHAVVAHLKRQARPRYERFAAINPPVYDPKKPGAEAADEDGRDARYDQAVELVVQAGKASASLLQRRMKIGYPTAARLIEAMEEDGIVGPKKEGGREREVLRKPSSTL
ncbi:MAG: DNA translocase FtsK 4TM domain-containing protein [Nitrospirae bacterium]|nr:DNA translocase FtsK 4TM domain-containing protein [Nitrospirota bacterium]